MTKDDWDDEGFNRKERLMYDAGYKAGFDKASKDLAPTFIFKERLECLEKKHHDLREEHDWVCRLYERAKNELGMTGVFSR